MFRINTFEIPIPPLRERVADIPALAEHLFRRFRPGTTGTVEQLFTPEAIEALQTSPWPGNVREIANVIEHATILADEPPITVEHLPDRLTTRRVARSPRRALVPDDPARTGVAGHRRSDGTPPRQQAGGRRRAGNQPQDALQQTEPDQPDWRRSA